MYGEAERTALLDKIIEFMNLSNEFEGLLQIGSGAVGFSDIYSDIDLMAGCFDEEAVKSADEKLTGFLSILGAFHIEKRKWTGTALGISAYFENGLSADISFMPTYEIPIRSPLNKIIFAKIENFTERVNSENGKAEQTSAIKIENFVEFRFINELRYAKIAILRGQFIFVEISLNDARQLLLSLQTAKEGKKLHQFKAYNSLDADFIKELTATYPQNLSEKELNSALENIISLYTKTAKNFDKNLLKLINCFE